MRRTKQATAYGECARDVGPSPVCCQLDLRARCTAPDQGLDDRRAKVPCDLVRLIEASLMLAAPMQRHGHDAVGMLEQLASAPAHAFGKRSRQRESARVFQRVNDLSKGPFVFANRTCAPHSAGASAAVRAQGLGTLREGLGTRDWGLVQPGQWVATPVANRRGNPKNRLPAISADTAGQRLVEKGAAYGAHWRQHGRQ